MQSNLLDQSPGGPLSKVHVDSIYQPAIVNPSGQQHEKKLNSGGGQIVRDINMEINQYLKDGELWGNDTENHS